MRRGGAAAPADNTHAQGDQAFVESRHVLGRGGEHGFTAAQLRQAGIGLGDQRHVGDGAHLLQHGIDPLRPQTAVGSDYVEAEPIEGDGSGLRRRTEHRPSTVVKGHQRHHRQIGELAAGDRRCPQFADIEKRLQSDQIGACRRKSANLLGENVDHLVKGGISHRLDEAPGRPDRRRNELPGGRRPPGNLDARGVDHLQPVLQVVVGQLGPVAAEGVGHQNIRPGIGEFPVHPLHDLGPKKVHLLGAPARLEAARLQHGSHGPVEHQDAFIEGLPESIHPHPPPPRDPRAKSRSGTRSLPAGGCS